MTLSTHRTPITMTRWPRLALALPAAILLAGCSAVQGAASAAGGTAAGGDALFDGRSLQGWQQVGPGRFVVQPDGSVLGEGGMGMLYYKERPFRDFALDLDYKAESRGANSGIFVRFPEPKTPDDAIKGGYEI